MGLMGTQPPNELLPLYSREEISVEQAVGHILQNLVEMQKSNEELRKELEALKKENARLRAFVGMDGKKE
jgi:hypothetical protein